MLAFSALAMLRLSDRAFGAQAFRLLVALALLPWIASFGTNNDLPYHSTLFAGFAAIALVVATLRLARRFARLGAALAIGGAVVSLSNLGLAAQNPYRLAAPILSQTVPTEITPGGAVLRLDPATHEFVKSLRDAAAANGFAPGEPVIDFTGITPGAALLVGARPIGPWIFGGYPWSEAFARRLVASLPPEERRRAWVLTGDGPFAFPPSFVAELGLLAPDRGPLTVLKHPFDRSAVRLHAPSGSAR
jgi:hypothetical protein